MKLPLEIASNIEVDLMKDISDVVRSKILSSDKEVSSREPVLDKFSVPRCIVECLYLCVCLFVVHVEPEYLQNKLFNLLFI